ncbi:hypothetical protein EC919_101200 [Pseudomonas graminis]|nr:hypothetical protein EC919_101200 [Pseudomonas graminis]
MRFMAQRSGSACIGSAGIKTGVLPVKIAEKCGIEPSCRN